MNSNKMSNGLIAFSRVPSQGLEKSLCTFIGLTTRQLWHQLQHNLLLQNALRNPDALIVMFGFITHLSFSSYLKASGYGLEFLEKWYLRSSHLKQLCTVMECHSYRNKRGELAHKRVSVLSGWGRNPLFPPQALIFSLHVVNNQPYMCKRAVGLGFDTASVGVIDVQKSNPSQGGQVEPSRQSETTLSWKRTFFPRYLCQSVTVSLLNWKSMQRKKKPKWSHELKYSLHRIYLNCAKISVWRKRERKEKRNGIHFSFPRASWKHLLSGLQSETVSTSVKKQDL